METKGRKIFGWLLLYMSLKGVRPLGGEVTDSGTILVDLDLSMKVKPCVGEHDYSVS